MRDAEWDEEGGAKNDRSKDVFYMLSRNIFLKEKKKQIIQSV